MVQDYYFIQVNYTQSNLSAMERGLLNRVMPSNHCLIYDRDVDNLVAFLKSAQDGLHQSKPRLKTVDISKWGHIRDMFVNVGQINMHLTRVNVLPIEFVEMQNKAK